MGYFPPKDKLTIKVQEENTGWVGATLPAARSTIQSSDARVGGLVSKPSFFTLGLLEVRLSMDQSHPERQTTYLSPQSVGKSVGNLTVSPPSGERGRTGQPLLPCGGCDSQKELEDRKSKRLGGLG